MNKKLKTAGPSTSLSDCLGCQAMVMEKMKNGGAVFHLSHNHGYDEECVLEAQDGKLRA
jgi:hypothetical protein